jgi:hypothetical protein
MDTRNIGALLLKITGLVLIVICVSQLPAYFPLTGRGYDFSIGEVLATAAIALGPLVLIGLVLWFFPGTVTNKIVSDVAADQPLVDSHALQLVALTIVGVYLVADGLVGAARDVVLLIFMQRQNENSAAIPASVIAHVGATVAKLVIGASLCIGAKGVSRIIERLRR